MSARMELAGKLPPAAALQSACRRKIAQITPVLGDLLTS